MFGSVPDISTFLLSEPRPPGNGAAYPFRKLIYDRADQHSNPKSVVGKLFGISAKKLLNRAYKRVCDAHNLTVNVFSKIILKPSTSLKNADARVIRAVLSHELQNQKDKDWRLDEAGMSILVDHYFMMREFNLSQGHTMFYDAVGLYGSEFLNKTDLATYQSLKQTDEKKAKSFLYSKAFQYVALLWFYAITLSHNLFVTENQISAWDAYWLGIIDEVKGAKLPSERTVTEEKKVESVEATTQ